MLTTDTINKLRGYSFLNEALNALPKLDIDYKAVLNNPNLSESFKAYVLDGMPGWFYEGYPQPVQMDFTLPEFSNGAIVLDFGI